MPSSPPSHTNNTQLACCRPANCLIFLRDVDKGADTGWSTVKSEVDTVMILFLFYTVHTHHLVSPLLLLSGFVQFFSEGTSSQRAVLLQLPPQILQLSSLPARQTQEEALKRTTSIVCKITADSLRTFWTTLKLQLEGSYKVQQ